MCMFPMIVFSCQYVIVINNAIKKSCLMYINIGRAEILGIAERMSLLEMIRDGYLRFGDLYW